MRAFLTARWAPITAALATIAYAVAVIGFGLVYRPLHNDEGVTLSVASHDSWRDVLDVAINERHGPPLHYLAVHASLLVRDDMLGLRLPSALFGILAVALAYGFGRELLGRSCGAVLAVLVAVSPEVVHLAQFARGYTAMLAASFGSLWLLLLLVRTRRARYLPLYALSALALAASHPFALFALASELVMLVVLGLAPLRRGWQRERRNVLVLLASLVSALVAMVLLWLVYSQLRHKYGVGEGGPVVDLASAEFWRRLGDAWTGSSYALAGLALAVAALAGLVMLAFRDRRAALILGVWMFQPMLLLAVLTASSNDFAPERHLSFLIPAYTAALASFLVEVGRRGGRCGPWIAAALAVAVITPGVVALSTTSAPSRPTCAMPASTWATASAPATCCFRPAACPRTASTPPVRRLCGAGGARRRSVVAVAGRRQGHRLRPGRAARPAAASAGGLGDAALARPGGAAGAAAGARVRPAAHLRAVRGRAQPAATADHGGGAVGGPARLSRRRLAQPRDPRLRAPGVGLPLGPDRRRPPAAVPVRRRATSPGAGRLRPGRPAARRRSARPAPGAAARRHPATGRAPTARGAEPPACRCRNQSRPCRSRSHADSCASNAQARR